MSKTVESYRIALEDEKCKWSVFEKPREQKIEKPLKS
jgi:hypothetical protein